MSDQWQLHNPSGTRRILLTKMLPGDRWLAVLKDANCRVEVCRSTSVVPKEVLIEQIGTRCAGVIGQLTEEWDEELFEALKAAGGSIYCNYAVGYDNVAIDAATQHGIAVGNTPGVLTETTAEMAAALTLACARRIVEADRFAREGRYKGWLPDLLLGERLNGNTVGVVGAGRIGAAYGRMMSRGFAMHLMYFSRSKNEDLEASITHGDESITVKRAASLKDLLKRADIVSLHTPLNKQTRHMIGARELSLMKDNAILINTSRGPIVDEAALARHCREHTSFKAGLDVFEEEPLIHKELTQLDNVTLAPHLGSSTRWTRAAMALLASLNVKGVLERHPLWKGDDITDFLKDQPPQAIPSIVNASAINIP